MAVLELAPAESARLLGATHWAGGLGADVLDAIARHTSARSLARGERLVEESEEQRWMGFIVKGECEVSQSVLGSDARVLRIMGPGRVFGELALLGGAPRTATLEALDEVIYLRMDPAQLDALAAEDPAAAYALMRHLAIGLTQRILRFEQRRF